jgi:hypothetical protein
MTLRVDWSPLEKAHRPRLRALPPTLNGRTDGVSDRLDLRLKIAPRLVTIPTLSCVEAILHPEHVEALEELSRLEVINAGARRRLTIYRICTQHMPVMRTLF